MEKLNRFILPLIVFVVFFSCKDDYKHPVPDVYVSFTISLYSHFELQNVNGYIYVDTYGYNGIVIFRYSTDEFMAFDRACPHNPYDHECKIEVDDPPIAVDNCCESRFLLIDGSVIDGPSKHPLKPYRTYFDAEGNYLQVTN